MRYLIAAVAFGLLLGAARADDKKDDKDEKKEESKLKVGDAAPALKVDKWLQGSEVKSFEAGKVYVVEFWATWCGPCIVMMPHLGEMQAEYKDQGVTFIGFTTKDPNNSAEKVAEFVKKRGPKLGYTFAYSDSNETDKAWMKAAKQNGIPCSFVVDKKGKIAYIGHPLFLGIVMPKVVAGSWGEADVKKLGDIEKEMDEVFTAVNGRDAKLGLETLADFEKKYPGMAHIPFFIAPKISLLLKAKKVDEAKKFANEVVSKAMEKDDAIALMMVSQATRGAEDKEAAKLSITAAEGAVKVNGDKDVGSLMNLAEAYFAAGDKAKARDAGAKALNAATGRQKDAVEKAIKKYEDEKKEEKKDEKKKDDK